MLITGRSQEVLGAKGTLGVREMAKPPGNPRKIAIALHGIEPATFERCALIRDWLDDHGVGRVTLLVIPARDMHPVGERAPAMVDWLSERRLAGDSIAQHGFQHDGCRHRHGEFADLDERRDPSSGSCGLAGPQAGGHRAGRVRGARIRLHQRPTPNPRGAVPVVGGAAEGAPSSATAGAGAPWLADAGMGHDNTWSHAPARLTLAPGGGRPVAAQDPQTRPPSGRPLAAAPHDGPRARP